MKVGVNVRTSYKLQKARSRKPMMVRLELLDEEEYDVYLHWRKWFGEKISLFAAEQHVWYLKHPDHPEVSENIEALWKKRISRIAYMTEDEPHLSRDQIILRLDKQIVKLIRRVIIDEEKDYLTEDNIFYELRM